LSHSASPRRGFYVGKLHDIQISISIKFCFVFRWELRTLQLQSRHSTIWATPLVHFALLFLRWGGGFANNLPRLASNLYPPDLSLPIS
jgi:hypothetical protein